MAQVIVSTALGLPGAHRQQRRSTFQSLNLALLIDALSRAE
jgi:hypothetical protein